MNEIGRLFRFIIILQSLESDGITQTPNEVQPCWLLNVSIRCVF